MSTEPTTYRIDKEVKESAYSIFKQIGLKPSQAINLFLSQVALRGAIPFELRGKVPNQETLQAFEESKDADSLEGFNSFSELRKKLDV